jgi:hypothetical protein
MYLYRCRKAMEETFMPGTMESPSSAHGISFLSLCLFLIYYFKIELSIVNKLKKFAEYKPLDFRG